MSNENSGSKVNYIAMFLTGLISLIVGVSSSSILNYFNEKSPELTYEIITKEIFSGDDNKIGILVIRISNSGNLEIGELKGVIELKNGGLREVKIVGIPKSQVNFTNSSNQIELSLDYLNPNEDFSVQALMSNVNGSIDINSIELRAKGVVGNEKTKNDNPKANWLSKNSPLLAAFATLLMFVVITTSGLMRKILTRSRLGPVPVSFFGQLNGDQLENFVFALRIKGFEDLAIEIEALNREMKYWVLSDRLTEIWLKDRSKKNKLRGIEVFEFIMENTSIAGSSADVLTANIIRLYLALGDVKLAKSRNERLRKEGNKMANLRIDSDSKSSLLKEITIGN